MVTLVRATETIQWESYGNPANTFLIEYSIDNGANWITINAAVACKYPDGLTGRYQLVLTNTGV